MNISSPSFLSPPSLQPDDLVVDQVEATAFHGDHHGKWLKLWWPKSMSFRSLVILLSLLVGTVIFEHYSTEGARWSFSSFLRPPRFIGHSSRISCETSNPGYKLEGIGGLPRGIVEQTSDLFFRALGANPIAEDQQRPTSQSLLAMPVGIKQKEFVSKIIEKFPAENFTIMLFHYDGIVDEWNTFPWSSRAIHVVAVNQTKWWFAKRFLHPDIVVDYKYIFVWDEDIGVENFHASKYLDIVENEGLEISQPALDPQLSEVHHQITIRNPKGKVHRRIYKFKGSGLCFDNSTQPPCTGWVEMMVPVFSRAAWRCTWYMIQNDFVHAWGLDKNLGYCVQGDRTRRVGVVDDQYVVHYGIPSLGGPFNRDSNSSDLHDRGAVRKRSSVEQELFKRRWDAAANQDKCWIDPY